YDEIDRYCREAGIAWFASAWDAGSQEFLKRYDLAYNKVASAMLTHMPLLEMIAQERKPTFISTGMSNFEQVDAALEIFKKHDCPYTLLHCVSAYPCPDEDCNVSMVTTLRDRYQCPVGYSGHEVGILPSVLAVSLGAGVIERHITLDRAMYGSDQAASLEQRGLAILVRDCRQVKSILGSGEKTVSPAEVKAERSLRYFRQSDD
ncbi:MAG: N-acetylneuraminate synthase, partial [Desulfovibrio sp.]|nr:N-acetylneuraminate synthase [Desulfovibrio sp.]